MISLPVLAAAALAAPCDSAPPLPCPAAACPAAACDAPCEDGVVADPAAVGAAGAGPIFRAIAPLDETQASGLAALGGFTLSANAALASQYRYRGTNLSGDRIAVQGGLDLDHASGFYVGVWGSTLDGRRTGYGDVELDIYAGYTAPVIEGVTADLGVIAYTFPDAPVGGRNFVELTAALTASLGPARAKVGAAWDPGAGGFAFAGFVRDNLYVYSDVSVGIPATPLTVKAHLGYTDGTRRLATNSGSFDWSVGASYAVFGPVSASLEYVDAGADVRQGLFNPNSGNLVARISVNF
jgi:uncharacterized protein (TIGR02001 family)